MKEKYYKILFVVAILAALFGLFQYNYNAYKTSATKEIIEKFREKDSLMAKQVSTLPDSLFQTRKLKSSFQIIQKIKEPYLGTAFIYGSNGYAYTMLFVFSSITTSLMTFWIVRKGWENIGSYYIRAGFILLLFTSTFSGVMQGVSDTKENTRKNIERYYFYNALQYDVLNQLNDNQGLFARKEYGKVDSFLNTLNIAIKSNADIYFNFEIDKVPKELKPF